MIPKIVHYIWFGGKPFPEKVQRCIESWQKYLPDYEFRLWNEETFDVNSVEFTKQAYANQKWAFVSDYVRVKALFEIGGWYLDTDVEIVKPLAPLEGERLVLGTDEIGELTALMGSEKGHPYWKEILDYYHTLEFVREDGSLNMVVNNKYLQDILEKYGYVHENKYQELKEGIIVFPDDYFHVVSFMKGDKHQTKNTYAIHWHTLLWVSKKTHINRWLRLNVLRPLMGGEISSKLFLKLHSIFYK